MSEKMLFQTVSSIESIATRSDNTLKIVIGTPELEPEEAAVLFGLKGKEGWFLFSNNEIKQEEVPVETAPEFKTDKTPSQRLRSVLYIYWKNNTNKVKPFDTFYKEWIEKKINEIKDTLNP